MCSSRSSLITGIADATDYDLDLFDPYVHADKSQAFKALTKLGLPAVPAIVESLDRLGARRKVLALLALTEITGLRSRDIERYSTIRQPVPDSIAIELFEPSPAYLSASFGQSIAWWRNFVEENAASWE